MNSTILKFNNISFCYNHQNNHVLQELSLDVPTGSVTAILGPNGAGKTTLLHLAMGWLKPQRGNIYFDDKNINQYSRREMGQRIGLVPQSEYIAFEYSLLEYVLLGRAPYLQPLDMPSEYDCKVALSSLELVGMGNLKKRSITSISGGERQLVMLARSMTQQPRLLLLDEPTSHLDLANKSRLLKLLHEHVESGMTILLTTHEPELVTNIATHVILMRDGKILFKGLKNDALTSELLTATYGSSVKVCEIFGKRVVLWD